MTFDGAHADGAAWSPDGKKIAFHSDRLSGNNEIYTMDPDGSNITAVTNNPASDRNPSWNQKSTQLAFESDRSGNYEIYTINADGTNLVRVTNYEQDDFHPSWSSDGRKIAW